MLGKYTGSRLWRDNFLGSRMVWVGMQEWEARISRLLPTPGLGKVQTGRITGNIRARPLTQRDVGDSTLIWCENLLLQEL